MLRYHLADGCVVASLRGLTRREVLAMASAPLVAESARPNVLFIMADDLGYAGSVVLWPNGLQDSEYRSSGGAGDAVHAGLCEFGGVFGDADGVDDGKVSVSFAGGSGGAVIPDRAECWFAGGASDTAFVTRGAGYETTLVGKWHLGWLPDYSPLQRGYEHFWGFRSGGIDYYTHQAAASNTDSDNL